MRILTKISRLRIKIRASKPYTSSNSPVMSGFINVGHSKNSGKDWKIPIFHKDQYIAILDDELFRRGCLIKVISA